jgi:hypothetical protein
VTAFCNWLSRFPVALERVDLAVLIYRAGIVEHQRRAQPRRALLGVDVTPKLIALTPRTCAIVVGTEAEALTIKLVDPLPE